MASLFGGAAKGNNKRESVDLEARHHKGAGGATKGAATGGAASAAGAGGLASLFGGAAKGNNKREAELEARHHKVSTRNLSRTSLLPHDYKD